MLTKFIKQFTQRLAIFIFSIKSAKEYKTMIHCYTESIKDSKNRLKFSFNEYFNFWILHIQHTKNTFVMVNRDGSQVDCKIVYFPLPNDKDFNLKALIEIIGDNYPNDLDLREVPVHYLKLKFPTEV